ncbi:MAG TPA: response regulator transcription factor, partial [Bryobacteraceae bacterium]|nr:response regulator transcription factor [Bryobacteraceae bacterium]
DDHAVFRKGIVLLVASESDMQVVAEATNGREAVEQYRKHRPDITLMDLQMDKMCGADAVAAIVSEFPEARIIVLTTYEGDARVVRAYQAGASGYVLKGSVAMDLLETIRSVHAGEKRIPPEIAAQIEEDSGKG